MLPEGVARHWNKKLVSVFLINLMSFPILQVRLIFVLQIYNYYLKEQSFSIFLFESNVKNDLIDSIEI